MTSNNHTFNGDFIVGISTGVFPFEKVDLLTSLGLLGVRFEDGRRWDLARKLKVFLEGLEVQELAAKESLVLLESYTTWKVDGATPMYWFIMAPYKSPPFGSCAIYFHHGVNSLC